MTSPRAVSMMIRTRLFSRMRRQTSKPSIPGSITSRITTSGPSSFNARRPSDGWVAAPRADGHAQPDLARPLANGQEHERQDSRPSHNEGNGREPAGQQLERIGGHLLRGEELRGVLNLEVIRAPGRPGSVTRLQQL